MKSFTCEELGGVCDVRISGSSFEEIIQKGMEHMKSDQSHIDHMMNLSNSTGESKEEWFSRMKKEFDARSEDN